MSIEDVFPKSRSVRLLRRDPNGDPYDEFIDGVPEWSLQAQKDLLRSPTGRVIATMLDALADANGMRPEDAVVRVTEHRLRAEGPGFMAPDQDLHTPHGPPEPPHQTPEERERGAAAIAFHEGWTAWFLERARLREVGEVVPDLAPLDVLMRQLWLEGVDVEEAEVAVCDLFDREHREG